MDFLWGVQVSPVSLRRKLWLRGDCGKILAVTTQFDKVWRFHVARLLPFCRACPAGCECIAVLGEMRDGAAAK